MQRSTIFFKAAATIHWALNKEDQSPCPSDAVKLKAQIGSWRCFNALRSKACAINYLLAKHLEEQNDSEYATELLNDIYRSMRILLIGNDILCHFLYKSFL